MTTTADDTERPRAEDRRDASELAERREWDAAALRVTQRIRSALALDEVLQRTIDELGEVTNASRSIIQLAPNADGVSLMYEWDRGDTRPLGLKPPTPVAARVFETGDPIVVGDRAQLGGGAIRDYLDSVDSVAAVAYPLVWRERTIAVVGFQDSRPRSWHDHALPLLERVGEQLAAALVQAELLDQQGRNLAELENLNRMREELIANVSHELRTPISAILGGIKTLKRADVPATTRDEVLDVLDAQSVRLKVLVEDLLDLSRFHRGTKALSVARTSFSELVRLAVDGIMFPEGRDLAVRIDEDVPLDVDLHRMCQVLANLVENAVKHGHGTVTMRCLSDGVNAVVHVSDEGGGIPAEYADEMFEPFARSSDRTDSSGLGLAIARAIVEAHGGTLVYLQPLDDRPHQFVVTLPQTAAR